LQAGRGGDAEAVPRRAPRHDPPEGGQKFSYNQVGAAFTGAKNAPDR
jgi:hypothetical protein